MNGFFQMTMIFNASCPRSTIVGAVFLLEATLFAQQAFPPDVQRACNGAKNLMELNQCAGEQYRKADGRLNAAYNKALEMMQKELTVAQERKDSDWTRYFEQSIAKLRAAQRAWSQYRDLHCEAARHQYEGGSVSPMIYGFCMAQTTLDRIEELKSAYGKLE